MSAKEISETVKNYFTIAATIVGGIWVYYQWGVIFPKTQADVLTAAATVRTDVSGEMKFQMGIDRSVETVLAADSSDGDLSTYCTAHPDATFRLTTPMFGTITINSASKVPVMSRVARLRLLRAPSASPAISIADSHAASAKPMAVEDLVELDDDGLFAGGLRENRIEAGQSVSVSFMFDADIPINCKQLNVILLVQADLDLNAIDPASGKTVGAGARKVLVYGCKSGFGHGDAFSEEIFYSVGQ